MLNTLRAPVGNMRIHIRIRIRILHVVQSADPQRVSLNTDRTTARLHTTAQHLRLHGDRRPTAHCPFHRPTARPHVVNDPIIANYPTTHSDDISMHGPTVITTTAFYKRRANETTLSPREVFT